MKRGIILFIVFLLTVSLAYAAEDFDITVTALDREVKIGDTAEVEVTIDSSVDTIENFRIYTPGVAWISTEQDIKLYPQGKETAVIEISPTTDVKVGLTNIVSINLKNLKTGDIIEKKISIFVKAGSMTSPRGNYAMAVDFDASFPSKIDPREEVIATVVVDNLNPLNLSDLRLRMTSDLAKFNTEESFAIPPLGKKGEELTFNLNPLQSPGEHEVKFELLRGEDVVEELPTKTFEIEQINPPYRENIQKENSFLLTKVNITYTSESNVDDEQKVRIPITTIQSWFTKVSPDARIVKDEGKLYYYWDVSLEPGENFSIFMVRSYRILFYIILVLIAIFALYAYYSSPIKIKKSITDVQIKEGGISELKIMLEIKSYANKAIKHVDITDYIPNIAEVEKHFVEGTLKPDKMLKHKSKGTVLKWELDEIMPGEDRLISYSIKSTLSITGNFRLPRAKIEFKHKKRKYYAYSNGTGVST